MRDRPRDIIEGSLGADCDAVNFGDSLYWVLVEIKCINGLPRQKVVGYLGRLDECLHGVWIQINFGTGPLRSPINLNLLDASGRN
jgi:hypothetical protein